MKRRDFLFSAAAGAAMLATPELAGASVWPFRKRPNVIIVISDDQGYGDMGCHGQPFLKTPQMDRIHDQSVRFTDFHSAPMCTPTRSQLLTGRHCLVNGAMKVCSGRSLIRPELPLMPELFADSGYRTGHFGKWHLGDNYPFRPIDRGFEESVTFPASHIGSAPDYWHNDYFDDVYSHNGQRQRYTGYCTDVFFDQAISWMNGCSERHEPFFCYLPTNAPHEPALVDFRYREMIKDQKLDKGVEGFFGMIANLDDNLGKLDDFLHKSGQYDNTILIFMSDNGTACGRDIYNAGMRGKKGELYEGGHRVHCFMRWPQGKLRASADLGEPTQMQDILPTLIDLCRLKTPKKIVLEGTNLAPIMRGEESQLPDRMLVTQFCRAMTPTKNDAVVLWQRWRLVQGKELYQLDQDPGQKQNVFAEHPGVVAKMQAFYDQWWAGVEPRLEEFSAIIIGSDKENPSMLAPPEWEKVYLDTGWGIREGQARNGAWNVVVDRAGEYEFELRRWPVESDIALNAGTPVYIGVDGIQQEGVALPIAQARIKVADFDASQAAAPGDKCARFTAQLQPGRTKLQTWFSDAQGKELCGAYYVYVQRK